MENTRDTFYTQSVESGFKKNLFYPNSSIQFQSRKFSSHSRNNSRISNCNELSIKFSLTSFSAFDKGRRKNHSPSLKLNNEKSVVVYSKSKGIRRSRSECIIKEINVFS
jgi:hypothetical protein